LFNLKEETMRRNWISSALKTALYLMEVTDQASDNVRDRVSDRFGDVRSRAGDTYDTVSERVSSAARALRGENGGVARSAMMFAGGLGAGLALGVIFAPASGEETRRAIVERIEDLGTRAERSSAA
jgi:gas vesicle protein